MTRPRIDDRTKNNLLVAFAVAQGLGAILVFWIGVGTWDASKAAILFEGAYQGRVAVLTLLLWYLAEQGRTD